MQYKFAKEQLDYSDFASGRVFYSLPGHPAFPVRLASEIFQRCLAHRQAIYGMIEPATLYDPCCGTAYHLSVLAYLHGEHIREVIGSDIDRNAVELAKRNLGLLSLEGLETRIHEISEMSEQYGKESHRGALQSAFMLKEKLSALTEKQPRTSKVFQANAMDRQEILNHIQPKCVDLVFTDVPYGRHSNWRDSRLNALANPLVSMLDALYEVVSPSSMIAISSDKQQKVRHEKFQRVEQILVGKRRVVILKPSREQNV
jgi:16S rRNA G966 N2-methylase RsmD